MAFRKRNVVLSSRSTGETTPESPSAPAVAPPAPTSPGVRPSPIDGRPTTSTGTRSLDSLLAGHAGLPLGNSILIEESGTTDYAGALLRFYAAEGVVQEQKVHVVGMTEAWGRELPGIAAEDREDKRKEGKERAEKMKIAWRYEGLGQFESARGAFVYINLANEYIYSNLHLTVTWQAPQEQKEPQVKETVQRKKLQSFAILSTLRNASRYRWGN